MALYNLMKAADRVRYRKNQQDELDALIGGYWPRDMDDQLRWASRDRVQIRAMIESSIRYIDDLERRIVAGDPDLAGWEPQPAG